MENRYMRRAIQLAQQAAAAGEVPVGAVVVRKDEIIAEGQNGRERGKNALCHAELAAIHNACTALGGWRLSDCDLYVTLEPCPMCAGAILNARIRTVYFGAFDPKAGSCGSKLDLFSYGYNHRPELVGGMMEQECGELLSDFFRSLREKRLSEKTSNT